LGGWWERVGTEAHTLEEGLLRFETYRVDGEDVLVIHETFDDTDVLKFHLTKGTAAIFKSDNDKVAAPENYYFRKPVSWTICTYSNFMRLSATHSSQGSHHTVAAGTMSEGTTAWTSPNRWRRSVRQNSRSDLETQTSENCGSEQS
jgi:hypothetical protein